MDDPLTPLRRQRDQLASDYAKLSRNLGATPAQLKQRQAVDRELIELKIKIKNLERK